MEDLGLYHFSVGDFLRSLAYDRNTTSESSSYIRQYISTNQLMPGEELVSLIKQKMLLLSQSEYDGVLLDGFPRSYEQQVHYSRVVRPSNVGKFSD